MVAVKHVVLDVLKPHQPNALDFSRAIARAGPDYHVFLTVIEMDENTETVRLEVRGDSIDFEQLQAAIAGMSGSLHSIDEVEVRHEVDAGSP